MTKNIKIFLIGILLSLPFWWGVNAFQKNFENFVFSKEIEKNPPSFLLAKIASDSFFQTKSQTLEIGAKAVLSVQTAEGEKERVLFQKAENEKLPIASLTKLMTALVAFEFYQPSLKVPVSQKAVAQEEEKGNLKVGEILKTEDLLYITLIESSNDAAFALSEVVGERAFVDLMNLKAKDIGLQETYFSNPTGLDSENNTPFNYSTVRDLVNLVKYLIKKKPEILEILGKKEHNLWLENGVFHHTLLNTNELLGEIPNLIAGKTGFTDKARGCLIVILRGKKPASFLINVILGSSNRFEEMRKLIDYLQ
ncbi:MAG: serine hydrolase [Patescibacteria group bacterium]|nr:serine hydrolase [Patescibacteria group bacterium]